MGIKPGRTASGPLKLAQYILGFLAYKFMANFLLQRYARCNKISATIRIRVEFTH